MTSVRFIRVMNAIFKVLNKIIQKDTQYKVPRINQKFKIKKFNLSGFFRQILIIHLKKQIFDRYYYKTILFNQQLKSVQKFSLKILKKNNFQIDRKFFLQFSNLWIKTFLMKQHIYKFWQHIFSCSIFYSFFFSKQNVSIISEGFGTKLGFSKNGLLQSTFLNSSCFFILSRRIL